ncbi:unnamed protein product [Penicillium pancosmium]
MSSNQDSSDQASVDRQYPKPPNSTSNTNMPRHDNESSLTDLSDEELKKALPRKSLADSITKIALNKDDVDIPSNQASSNRAIHHLDLQSSKIRNEAKKPHHCKSLDDSITDDTSNKVNVDMSKILKKETSQNPQILIPDKSKSTPHSPHTGGPNVPPPTTSDLGSDIEWISARERKWTSDPGIDEQHSIYKLWLEAEDPGSLLRDNQPTEALLGKYIELSKLANEIRSRLDQNPCLADSDMLKGAVDWLKRFDWFSEICCRACEKRRH